MSKKLVSIVAPVFNEEDAVPLFIEAVSSALASRFDVMVEFVFVNDGSTDSTLDVLTAISEDDSRVVVVDLSRNFGKEAALAAGLKIAEGDAVIPIDVDLQDPPSLISDMVDEWKNGFEVVMARRADRSEDTWAKRNAAHLFYWVHNLISNVKVPENTGDFRLLDRCVVDTLNELTETCRFNRGLFSWAGYRQKILEFERPERSAGKTKYNAARQLSYAMEGITSFSTVPLRIWSFIGAAVSMMSLLFAIYIVIKVLLFGADVPGYASLIVAVTFLGGLQLIVIGILGEYLGRTYTESKRRPAYVIRKVHGR